MPPAENGGYTLLWWAVGKGKLKFNCCLRFGELPSQQRNVQFLGPNACSTVLVLTTELSSNGGDPLTECCSGHLAVIMFLFQKVRKECADANVLCPEACQIQPT